MPLLGEVEQLVLLAVLRLGDDAHAVPLRALIRAEVGVELSRGTIYATRERLERKGYVTSWFSDPQAVRGGKAQARLDVTVGQRILEQSRLGSAWTLWPSGRTSSHRPFGRGPGTW